MATGKPEANGGIIISISRRTVIAIVLAVLGIGGGGTAALQLLPENPKPMAPSFAVEIDIAVLKNDVASLKEDLREVKAILRRQERDRGR